MTRRHTRSRRYRAAGAVAAALVLALTGVWFKWHRLDSGRYLTQTGQMRVIRLPDGSVATLNAATEIELRYSQGRRGIELIRGEANFKVAKDPTRPFVVNTGAGQVEALGTMFDVCKSIGRITVTLIEGAVAVTPDLRLTSNNSGNAYIAKAIESGTSKIIDDSVIVLTAGEQVSYPEMPLGSNSRTATAGPKVVHWQSRKLEFSNTPVLEAIARANRYSADQIVLYAPYLENARISGIFAAGRNDLFAEGLRAYFHLETVRAGDHTLILRASQK